MSLAKPIVLASAIAFLSAGIFGIAHAGMSTSPDGRMSGCPLMGVSALCHMSPLEHASALQTMLTALPFSGMLALLALLALLLALAITPPAPVRKGLGILFEPLARPPPRGGRCIPRDALQEAFSNGILNSRAF